MGIFFIKQNQYKPDQDMIIGMGLGYSMSFLFYVIPAAIGVMAAWIFIKKETKGKSLDQLAEEQVEEAA